MAVNIRLEGESVAIVLKLEGLDGVVGQLDNTRLFGAFHASQDFKGFYFDIDLELFCFPVVEQLCSDIDFTLNDNF